MRAQRLTPVPDAQTHVSVAHSQVGLVRVLFGLRVFEGQLAGFAQRFEVQALELPRVTVAQDMGQVVGGAGPQAAQSQDQLAHYSLARLFAGGPDALV